MSLWIRSLGGMLSGAGSVVFKTGLNLLVIPILIQHLGLDVFGLYLLLLAILELATLLNLGLGNALISMLGHHLPETQERRSYLAVGHAVFIGLALLILLGGLVFCFHFPERFHVQPGMADMARTSFLLMIVEAAILLYSSYNHAILLSHCAHQWTNLSDTLYYFIANAGSLVLLILGYDLTAVMSARLIGVIMRQALMTFYTWRLEPFAFRHGLVLAPRACKELFSLGGHAIVLNISIILSHKIDDLVIARFLPLSAVGLFEIVFRLLGVIIQVALKLSEGAFPLFARFKAEQSADNAKLLFLRMSSFLNIVSCLIILGIVCHYGELIRLFSAHRISPEQTWPVLLTAIPCLLSGVLQMPANALLFTWGHRKFLTVTSLIAAISNVVLSLILVQSMGVVGVALGTLIPQLIQHQAGLVRRTCVELGISAPTYLKQVHGALIIPLVVSYIWIQLFAPWVHSLAHAERWILFPILCACGGAFFLGLSVWFAQTASPQERALFDKYVRLPLQNRYSTLKKVS